MEIIESYEVTLDHQQHHYHKIISTTWCPALSLSFRSIEPEKKPNRLPLLSFPLSLPLLFLSFFFGC